MIFNRKVLAASAAIAALTAVAAYAIADPGHGHGGMGSGMGQGMGHGSGMGHGMMGMGPGQMGAQDPSERLAAIKGELALKPEQIAAWDAYTKVVTDTAAERRKVRDGVDRDAVHAMKPEDRQAFRDAMIKQRDEAYGKVKSAAQTLVAKLDDAQKAKARGSLPGLGEEGSGHGMGHGGGRHGMGMGHGGRH